MTEAARIWILLCLASAAICIADVFRGHRQKMAIMNVVWPLTMLYGGAAALWAYLAFGRNDSPQPRPRWQSIAIGAMHCGAGCVLGDMAGEWIVYRTSFTIAASTLLANYAADFVLAYTAGILFQYFAIAPMRGLGLRAGLATAIKADTLSLIAFEAGMFLWMWIGHSFHPNFKPNHTAYWLGMQIAMVVGFATSLPANRYLIGAGIKEAM